MTDSEIIEVVAAHKEGKKIEWVGRFEADRDINWRHDPNPKWNFEHLIYRVAPEPRKPREWLIKLDEYQSHAGYIIPLIPKGMFHLQQKYEEVRVREVLE